MIRIFSIFRTLPGGWLSGKSILLNLVLHYSAEGGTFNSNEKKNIRFSGPSYGSHLL